MKPFHFFRTLSRF